MEYIRKILIPFLKEHGEKRAAQETLDFYRAFEVLDNSKDEIKIFEVKDLKELVAISFCTIRDNKEVLFSMTVTHSNHRKKNYGITALKAKLDYLKENKLSLDTSINCDNLSGISLAIKAKMKKGITIEKRKNDGYYIAIMFCNAA
jgi:hypothetical protein